MKSISIQYQELKEGKMDKYQFLRNARIMFPNFVTNLNSFDDSVKILKTKGLLNEGDAVKGTPDKAPTYDYPTQPAKYKKVVQEPEVDEQDGIYPATTLTDIPKEEVSKPVKSKNRPDGLEPAKDKDKKNEMKKVRIVKESKKNLTEAKTFQADYSKEGLGLLLTHIYDFVSEYSAKETDIDDVLIDFEGEAEKYKNIFNQLPQTFTIIPDSDQGNTPMNIIKTETGFKINDNIAEAEHAKWDKISMQDAKELLDYHKRTRRLPYDLTPEKYDEILVKFNLKQEPITGTGDSKPSTNIEEVAETPDVKAILDIINNNSVLKARIQKISNAKEFKDFFDDFIGMVDSNLIKNSTGLKTAINSVFNTLTGQKKDFSAPMPSKPRTAVPFSDKSKGIFETSLKAYIKKTINELLDEK
jgi:hypothetical protein